ncbi:plasma-membrane choline transporter-domain-containing protein [Cladochytrium replicatum]|nr:plasma-membrane choline transporter-domain-containing protein [Cladochytrium replicatum]
MSPRGKVAPEHSVPDYDVKVIGPLDKRKCRDILFLILFILYWIGMWVVASLAVQTGDPRRLLLPTDTYGNVCGLDNRGNNGTITLASLRSSSANVSSANKYLDLSNKTFLYWLNPLTPTESIQVCVERCPTPPEVVYPATPNGTICAYNVPVPTAPLALLRAASNGSCAAFLYTSKVTLHRCVPDFLGALRKANETLTSISSNLTIPSSAEFANKTGLNTYINSGRDVATQAVADLYAGWMFIVAGSVFAFVACFVWIVLLRLFTKVLVWTTIVCSTVILVAGTIWVYFYWQGRKLAWDMASEADRLPTLEWEIKGSLAAFVVGVGASVLVVLFTIVMRNRIRIAVEVVRETASAIAQMPLIVLFPVGIFAALVLLCAYFVVIMLYLLTPVKAVVLAGFNVTYTDPNTSFYMQFYHLFGVLWGVAFVLALNQLVLSGAFATFYWTLDKHRIVPFPVLRSLYRAIRYHLGSLCLGSMLLALVWFLQILLSLLRRSSLVKNSKYLQFIVACIQCCVGCLEKIVKWINKHAYIMIAIRGSAFCKSAMVGFGLIVRNAFRAVAVDLVSDYIIFLSKVIVIVASAFATWGALGRYGADLEIQFPFIIVALVGVAAAVISSVVFSIFHMGTATVFMCFLEDCERNDGSLERPYFMSKNLKRITGFSNEKAEHMVVTAKEVKSRTVHVEEY